MWRLVVLLLLSIHINILQTPSLLLQLCAWGLNQLGHRATALQRAFVWYNRITQALFCSALVLVLSHKHATEIEIIETAETTASSLATRSLIIANHQTLLDWMFVWVAAWRMGRHGDLRIVLKDSLQRIPVFGWGMHFFSFIFVARKWAKDEQVLSHRCTHLRHTSTSRGGYSLLLFPEGTIISPDTLAKSHAFSEKRGDVYRCERVLVPRYKALWVCLSQLYLGLDGGKHDDTLETVKQQRLQSFVDMTIAYEPAINVKDGMFPEKVFSPRSLFLPDWSAPKNLQNWKIPPQRVQIMFETIDESEWAAFLVDRDEASFDEWLRMWWRRKENELESFQESRQLMKEGRKMKRTVFKISPSAWDIVSLTLAVVSAWGLVRMSYTSVVLFLNT
ncbi:hypothetical protein HDU81_000833 [Chytriomyces hyalinus]|nr:hypothetical protein HDU81_000833 [Chytriomyces hyalinus]